MHGLKDEKLKVSYSDHFPSFRLSVNFCFKSAMLMLPETSSSQQYQCSQWPSNSSDYNVIEHTWDVLGRCLSQRHPNLQRSGISQLQQEAARTPWYLLRNLCSSKRRRCDAVVAQRGEKCKDINKRKTETSKYVTYARVEHYISSFDNFIEWHEMVDLVVLHWYIT